MIIDFHTHVFPQAIAGRAIAQLEADAGVPSFREGTLDGLLGSMKDSGIDLSVTLPVATNPASVPSINRFALSQLDIPGVLPFGAIHPRYEDVPGELQRLKEAGIRGIKLHPDYQDAYIDDPAMVHILSCASQLGLIVVVHGGLDYAFPEDPHCTPRRVVNALDRCGPVQLVVAHYGGISMLGEVRTYLYGSGVFLDTSFTHNTGEGERDACIRILQTYDPERLLFATDSPWDDQAADVRFLRSLGLDSTLEEQILCRNAQKLLGFTE